MISWAHSEATRAMVFRAIGYGFPLLTIPFFAGAMTSAEYGRLGLALTFCALLQAIAEGGHTIGGAQRLIGANESQTTLIREAIYDQKIVLLIVCLIAGALYHFATKSSVRDLGLFAVCFFAVVVPDALTPMWHYQATGRISDLTRIQFFSRAAALPFMLVGIWVWPTAPAAALLSGLPFILCAWGSIHSSKLFRHLPGWHRPRLKSLQNLPTTQFLVYAGSIAATLTPMLAMQTMGLIYGKADFGALYLAVVLWLACRQLCGLANQSSFRRFVAAHREVADRSFSAVLVPARWGVAIGIVSATTIVAISILLPDAEGLKYAETLRALPWMLGGLVPYSLGHALAMNLFAASGRNGAYAVVHVVAAASLSLACVVLAPLLERPLVLGLSCLVADAVLLAFALAGSRFGRAPG